ncbi:MAG: ankyrin repeat domain-containing protein [Chamaesiphon sp.]|nr:ankyrin repeat domain-containing protein [Chamaesiphon sp.]
MSVDPQPQNLFDAISTVNYNRVKLIIDSGVAINHPNDRGQTPLMVARQRGNLEIVDLLITAGAQMQVSQEPVVSSAEVTYAFDLDEIFAANQISDSSMIGNNSEIFVDSELTMTSLNNSAQKVEFQPSETYAFDLSRDLDRLTAESQEEPDCLSVPMGEWEANETYVIDNFNLLIPELSESGGNLAQEGFLVDVLQQQESARIEWMIGTPEIDEDGTAMSEEWGEGETYAIDIDDLHLAQLMDATATEPQSLGVVATVTVENAGVVEDWVEGETYAIDLDDLNLAQIMGGIDDTAKSNGVVPRSSTENSFISIAEGSPEHNDTYTENETYAMDLSDLDLSRVMDEIDADLQSADISAPLAGYMLSDLDSSLFPVIAGEDEPDYTIDEDPTDIFGRREPISADLTPSYDENATNTSLMAAVIDDDLDLVKQSIEAGASLDRYDWNLGYAPLGMAIDRGHIEIVGCLLKAGANPHCGSTSTTSLGLAAENGEAEIIQLLLARRVDVNTPIAPDGWTALLAAIQNGHRAVVQLLVTAGANVNVWSRGETPIILAAKCEEREIYNYLYPLVNTAIRLCADRDGEHLLQATHKRRIRQQNRPIEKLIEMATEGNIDEVNRAIEIGIEIDELGAKGHTALMVAAYYGHRSIVNTLLAAGADPNLLSDDNGLGAGMTALMLAAGSFFASNRQQVAKLLIAGGADVNQRGAGGKTAVFYAALAGSGYLDCVETLIAGGANLDLHDDRGHTVLTSVATAENYSMLNLLMQAGASTVGLESIQLIQAAAAGNIDRVRSLLATKVNLDLDRGAAIGNAAAAGHTQIVELLIQAGANVNLTDKLGFSPIASAAYSGYSEIVNLLIEAGADIQAPAGESQSYSALEYAQMGLYQFDARPLPSAAQKEASRNSELPQPADLQHDRIIRKLQQLGSRG